MNDRVLVIAAHPDDEVLGCGGAILKHTSNADTVRILILAEGLTSREPVRDAVRHKDELVHLHENSEQAAKRLGAEGVRLCSFPDNRMDSIDLLDVVKEVEQEIEGFKPNIVYTHHGGDVNIDHQITHDAVVTACRPLPECPVKMLLFFEVLSSTEWQIPSPDRVFAPNWFVDIEHEIDGKLDALRCYASEMREYPHSRSYQGVKNLAAYRGVCVGRKYAEAFSLGRSIL